MPKLYERFSQFVIAQGIMRDTFCRRENSLITKDEFAGCFQGVNFPLTADEFAAILADLGFDEKVVLAIDMEKLYGKLACWKDVMENKKNTEMIANMNMELLEVGFRLRSVRVGSGQKMPAPGNGRGHEAEQQAAAQAAICSGRKAEDHREAVQLVHQEERRPFHAFWVGFFPGRGQCIESSFMTRSTI